jgi:6-phosphofructokinase 1
MANILKHGGTILKTGRSAEFMQASARTEAFEQLKKASIDAFVCIGGDGSFTGAHQLFQEHGSHFVGVPATIDNDIYGTDYTIGFDTAINIALDAIDRIRDTASSHDRLFIVEVMGHDSGFIAVDVGVAGGAEEIFFPENPIAIEQAIEHIKRSMARGKKSSILVTAEGKKPGRAYDLAEAIRKRAGFEAKVCVLGHIQRGGAPSARDRILASRLGAHAVEKLLLGESDIMIGMQAEKLVTHKLASILGKKKQIPNDLIKLAQILSA